MVARFEWSHIPFPQFEPFPHSLLTPMGANKLMGMFILKYLPSALERN